MNKIMALMTVVLISMAGCMSADNETMTEPEKVEPQPVNNFDLMRDVVIPGAEEQRQKEMKKLDDQFGPGGIVDIMKDRI